MDAVPFALGAGSAIVATLALAALRPAWIVGWPRSVLGLLAGVTLAAVAAAVGFDPPRLRIALDPSSEPLLLVEDPGQDVYRRAVRSFGNDDLYVIAMETRDVFTHESLDTLLRVTDRIRQLPGVRNVESLVNVHTIRHDPEHGWAEVAPFIRGIPSEPAELASLRARALADPLYPKTIVSPDGRTAGINITFQPMTDGEFVTLDLDGRIQAIVATEARAGQQFFLAGRPHVRSEAHHMMIRDLIRLIPVAILVGALLVWGMTGSVRGVLIPLVSCLTAALWAFGAMAAVGKQMNIITLVLGPMLICVGMVYGVHVIARYETLAIDAPDSPTAALRCLEYTRLPVLMAGLTTCVGFGALLLAGIPATSELGAFAVLGVAAVTLLSVTGVPAALALLPLEATGSSSAEPLYASRTRLSRWTGSFLDAALGAIGRVSTRRPGAVILAWALASVGAVIAIPHIVIDTDFLSFFNEDSRIRTDFAAVNRLLSGAVPIYVVLESETEGTFREPEALRAIEEIQRRLEAIPGVSHVLSAADLVRLTNRALDLGRAQSDRIPDTRAAVAEVIFLIPKEKLRRFATSNHSSANIVVRTGRLGSAPIRELEAQIQKVLSRSSLPPGVRAAVTGNAILINHSADGIARNQLTQVGFAAATILLLVCVVFRSLGVGLLSMIPNIVPVLVFFGILGLGAATLSLATSLIGSIALGIAIDDTMHFLVAYQRERAKGLDPVSSAERCVRRVGRPIAITSVMLVAGFLVTLLSEFATLREFGYLTAITMGICLCTDLTLFPALLVRLRA